MPITDWPEDQRPREKLIRQGAAVLSDAELLAVFLRTGVAGKSAVALAQDMLCHFGSLASLFHASVSEFSSIHGLGPAKYAQLQAVSELARRAISEELKQGATLSSPAAVRQYLQLTIGRLAHECFIVLFLDVKNRLISSEELARGTLGQASVYPREILKSVLKHNACSVILAHNHPSGHPEPSDADLRLTQTLQQALGLIDVRILDHFIVANPHVYSMAEHGQL